MNMEMFKRIELYSDPRKIFDEMRSPICEMAPIQQDFLCGLIKEKCPQKILEVGVAEGGTTAVIMQCLMDVNPLGHMYSVDLNERLYCNQLKRTGYLLDEVADRLTNIGNHEFLLGGVLPDFLERIGDEIDFAVLDTRHQLPGEILDYLCLIPHLSKDAIVVLHDVVLGVSGKLGINDSIATGVLFCTSHGQKYWIPDKLGDAGISNIGAIIVDEYARNNVENVFAALSLPWSYIPTEDEIEKYREIYSVHYPKEILELFDDIVFMQKNAYKITHGQSIDEEWNKLMESISDMKVYLFGAGKYAKRLETKLKKEGITVTGNVISDDQDVSQSEKCIKIRDYRKIQDDCILLYAVKSDEAFYKLAQEGIPVTHLRKEFMMD